jgi:hypothetical protein
MKSSPIPFIDQTLVDADIVATILVARKPPKPDVNNLEAPEQIIVEFAPPPIHRNGQDPGHPEHGRCASAGAAERAVTLRSAIPVGRLPASATSATFPSIRPIAILPTVLGWGL